MRPFSIIEGKHGTPRQRLGNRRLLSLWGLVLAIAAAATTVTPRPALATVDDNWAGPAISQILAERSQEAVRSPRSRGAVDSEDDGARPQRRAPVKHGGATRHRGHSQVASLGRDIAPANLRPLSVIEWARPNTTVLLPAAPPQALGPLVASLGREFVAPSPAAEPGLTAQPINWLPKASIDCLATPLRGVLADLAAAFGPITVRWTCRDKQLNARVGGAKRSYHLTGNAVDFNMTGNYRAILTFLKGNKLVGGLKHYGQGAFHIDTGPRRTW